MKKAIALLLALALCLSLCACGNTKPDSLSDETYNLGIAALDVMDQYLAGKMDDVTAVLNLSEIQDQLDAEGESLQAKADAGDAQAIMYSYWNGSVSFLYFLFHNIFCGGNNRL